MTTKPETPAEQALKWLRQRAQHHTPIGSAECMDQFRLAADELERVTTENAELKAAVTSAHDRADQWTAEAAKLAEDLERVTKERDAEWNENLLGQPYPQLHDEGCK